MPDVDTLMATGPFLSGHEPSFATVKAFSNSGNRRLLVDAYILIMRTDDGSSGDVHTLGGDGAMSITY
jgi:hypothetical protein